MTSEKPAPPRLVELPAPPSGDERTLAMLCHLSVLFGGVIVPGLIYLWRGRRSPFVAFHAKQAMAFQLLAGAIVGAAACLSAGAGALLVVVPLILGIVWALRANNGQWVGYPLLHRVIGS